MSRMVYKVQGCYISSPGGFEVCVCVVWVVAGGGVIDDIQSLEQSVGSGDSAADSDFGSGDW